MNEERRTKIKIELCSDRKDRWFIDFVPFKKQNESLGPFPNLDKALRYVYKEVDQPEGTVEITEVNRGLIFFIPDFKINYTTEPKKQITNNTNNVVPIDRGKKK
jgi:hypothetical protein